VQSVNLSQYAPEFEIAINGLANGPLRDSVSSVEIKEEMGNVAAFTVVLADQFDLGKQEFVWLDNPLIAEGQHISIKIGYASNMLDLIDGKIETVSTSGFSGEISRLTIQGYHRGHKTVSVETSGDCPVKLDKNDTYSKIAAKVADVDHLEKVIDDTKLYSPITAKKTVVYQDFLRDVARRVGFEFFIARNKFFFINPRTKKNEERKEFKIMTFEWGVNLIHFNPVINTTGLVAQVEVRGHAPYSKKNITGIANAGDEDVLEKNIRTGSQIALDISNKTNYICNKPKLDIKDRILASQEEAEDMAKAELNIASDTLITGTGSVVGTPELAPGQIIELKNIGRKLSGKYVVSGVTNTIDGSGFTTSFNVRRNVMG
jgi:uncharacterized protein